jgi:anti-sigma regulatory factor (Ser/Thr protein kinase)
VFDPHRPLAEMRASLAAEAASVGKARALLRSLLDVWGVAGEVKASALLVASELVNNAVSHGSRSGDEIDVAFCLCDRQLSVCVRDAVRGHGAPVALTPDEQRPQGRGLQVVAWLAAWSEQIVDGKREVCAQMSL